MYVELRMRDGRWLCGYECDEAKAGRPALATGKTTDSGGGRRSVVGLWGADREREEFNHVSVGILQEKLQSAVGTGVRRLVVKTELLEVVLPGREVVNAQSEVIAALV